MSLRNQQLHYIVFRQTAAHLPHEALIGVNYSTYKPTDEEILARYLLKFSKEAASGASHCLKVGQTANLLRIVITITRSEPVIKYSNHE